MSLSAAWMILAVGLAQAPAAETTAASSGPALPTIGVPGLQLEGGSEEDRVLLDQQLAAALEGAGFRVRDGEALAAMGARVPAEGCASAKAPLCGEVAGVDQVVLGRVVRGKDGSSWVELQLVKTGTRSQIWRGSFTAASDGEIPAGFSVVALEHLPSVARAANAPQQHRTMGLTRNQWGASIFTAGTLLIAGSLPFFAVAERQRVNIVDRGDITKPLYTRDVLRSQSEIPLLQGFGTSFAALGAAAAIGGFILWNAPEPTVSVSIAPNGDAGAVVFSGSF